jgi:hypothetical protein
MKKEVCELNGKIPFLNAVSSLLYHEVNFGFLLSSSK